MGSLFSKKKESRITEQDKAILQLKKQRDQLKQYSKRIQLSLEKDRQLAKPSYIRDKNRKICAGALADKLGFKPTEVRAKLLLKKKRFQEQLLTRTEGMLDNIEQMTHDLEFAQVEMKVLDGLKDGNAALKKMHDLVSIDEIERIMDETQEGIEKQKEIDDLLSGQLTSEDEDAVLAELDALVAAEDAEREAKLPDVPAEPLPEPEPEAEPAAERPKRERNSEKVALPA